MAEISPVERTVAFKIGEERHTLTVEVDQIDVTMMTGNWKFDPDWTFVDRAGHSHWAMGDPALFPTLITIVDRVYLVDDGDGYFDEMTDSHLACSICYEPIEPGRVPAPSSILGRRHYYLDGNEVTEEEANVVLRPHS